MHEAAIMIDLLQEIGRIAGDGAQTRVTKVSVWLGALSHFTPAHFQDHFESAARDGRAAGADLEIEISTDLDDPRAQSVVLKSVVLVDGAGGSRDQNGERP